MIAQPFDNVLVFQRETSFAASSAEPILKWRGRLAAKMDVQQGGNRRRSTIWRHETGNDRFGKWFMGRVEWEVMPNELLGDLFQTIFDIKSTTADSPSSGYTTVVYRPRRIGDPGSFKVGFEWQPDGPNYVLEGCVATRLNIRVDMNQMVKVVCNFVASTKTSYANSEQSTYSGSSVGETNVFESQYMEGSDLPSTSALSATAVDDEVGVIGPNDLTVEWDDVAVDELMSVGIDMGFDYRPSNFNRSGVVTRFRKSGGFQIGFSLGRLPDGDTTLWDDAEDNSEHKLEIDLLGHSDSTRHLKFDWKRVQVRNHDLPLLQLDSDPLSTLSLAGLQDSALDTGDEPTITLVRLT